MANPTIEELVLLKRLERQVGAHFIAPYLGEHLNNAYKTLADLQRVRTDPTYPQRGLTPAEVAQVLAEDLA